MTLYADKLLPHDMEAEEAVVGSILIDGTCITRLAPILKPEDFYRDRNRLCYEAALAIANRNQGIDQVTLAGELGRAESLDIIGGMAYLSHLVAITPTSVHAEDYAHTISRASTFRKLVDAGNRIVALGYEDSADLDGALRQAEDALYAVRDTTQTRDFQSFRDIFDRYLQQQASMDDLLAGRDAPIMSGFSDLDELLGGIQRSDLVILAARPSVGKSTLGLNVAMHNAKAGQTCAIFSLEMTADQIAMRALASETGIDSHRIRLMLYSSAQEERIINAIGELSELPIYIDDTPYQGMMEMRGKARRLDLDKGVDLIMVDYLQLVQGQNRRGPVNRVQEVTEISRGLKVMAGELDAAVIACSQMSRMGGEPAQPPAAPVRPPGQRLHRAGRRHRGLHTPGGPVHHRGRVGPEPPRPGVPPQHRGNHRGQEPQGSDRHPRLGVPRPPGPVRLGGPQLRRVNRATHIQTSRRGCRRLFLLRQGNLMAIPGDDYRSSSKYIHI